MHPDLFDVFRWLVWGILALAFVGWMRSIFRGPRAVVREQIESSLLARNVEPLDITTEWFSSRTGTTSRMVWVARGRNVSGTVQNFYFEADAWAAIFGQRPHIRELEAHEVRRAHD